MLRLARSSIKPYTRSFLTSASRTASVSDVGVSSSKAPKGSEEAVPDVKPIDTPEHLTRDAFDAKRQQKIEQYAETLKQKATKQGFSSVESMIEKQRQDRKTKDAEAGKTEQSRNTAELKEKIKGLTDQDAELAANILKRVEAEAQRKSRTGDFSSGPGGMKALGDIIDMDKVQSDSAEKISQLWTQYHTLKNKLSAVIPAKQYAEMVAKARRYPQFLLPLPRTIVGSGDENATANVAQGERKSGFEMQYMEWAFLPKPDGVSTEPSTLTSPEDVELIARAPPSTVLFTPLAEYKLRQEYAQPILVLTHYTDLAISKGVVLLRGEITDVQEASSAPTGVAAALAASKAGEKSSEKLDRLKAPLQSQGKLSAQDAQLLTVTLQRFYMPRAPGIGAQPGDAERQELLDAFHGDQERFDVDKLCKCALQT
jgi:ATP synthase F1 complex assembly factor 1